MSQNARYNRPYFFNYGPPTFSFRFIKSCIDHLNNTQITTVVQLEQLIFNSYSKSECLIKIRSFLAHPP